MNAFSGAIAAEAGLLPPLDEAAAAADPRHAFLRAAWFADAERTIVSRRPSGAVAAALPLARRGWLVHAAAGSYWPMRAPAIAADAGGAEIASLLRQAPGAVLRIGPVREDDPALARLVAAAPAAGWRPLRRRLGTAFLLDLAALRREGDWPSVATLRKNRWHERRLAEQGELGFEAIRGAAWSGDLFDIFAEIERNSWIGLRTDGRDAKFMAPHHRRFWESAARDPVLAQMMCGHLLRIGGRPAAFSFAIEAGPRLSMIANSYEERFARHSPGRVLLYRELRRAFEAGIDEVDWGAGDPGYKSEMGAKPGLAILDWLFVRGPALPSLLRPLWER